MTVIQANPNFHIMGGKSVTHSKDPRLRSPGGGNRLNEMGAEQK